MEAIAGAASFVSLALTATHGIYQTLSGIKDAPQTIQRLSSSVLTLFKLLRQLETSEDDLHLATDLPSLVDHCTEDLQKLEMRLVKSELKSSSKARQLKRNFTVMLQERQWDKDLALIDRHCAALSLQLNIIARYYWVVHYFHTLILTLEKQTWFSTFCYAPAS